MKSLCVTSCSRDIPLLAVDGSMMWRMPILRLQIALAPVKCVALDVCGYRVQEEGKYSCGVRY